MSLRMYVTLSEEDEILMFGVDADSGELVPEGGVAVSGTPAPLAVHPSGKFMFVGRRGIPAVSSYGVDPATGDLKLISTASLDSDPCYLATDKTGRFLLSSYYAAGRAAVHRIDDSGAVLTPPVEWLATGGGAHSIQTDSSNTYAFVPHIAGKGPNAIFQFRFDEVTGRLTPNTPPTVTPETEAGPRHFCFHPTPDTLYVSNEQGCSVTGYAFDRSSGTLEAFQTLSTLPDDYEGRNSCAQIRITPDGKFVYAPNRGHNSIACFAVDASTGRMTAAGRFASEPVPRAIGLDLNGRFLYAAGLESGQLASYRIDPDTGALERIGTYSIGAAPMWVLITERG